MGQSIYKIIKCHNWYYWNNFVSFKPKLDREALKNAYIFNANISSVFSKEL